MKNENIEKKAMKKDIDGVLLFMNKSNVRKPL
jgi:hypothetical protein